MPYGWNIFSNQACTKNPDQVRDKNHPSLLQEDWEYVIHSWTFVWGKRFVCPFYFPVSDNPHSHLPLETFVTVAAAGATISLVTSELGK
jgi:hypothetical protein